MRHNLAIALVAVCVVATPIGAARDRAPQSMHSTASFAGLLTAYRDGDLDAASEQLVTAADFRAFIDTLDQNVAMNLPWDRVRVAVPLEAAIVASQRAGYAVAPIVAAGRKMLMKRTTSLGTNPKDDAFELEWHKIAVALFERLTSPRDQERYLDDMDQRYASRDATAAGAKLDPWFVLARGIAKEQAAAQLEPVESSRLTALVKPQDTSDLAKAVREAAGRFDLAAALPSVEVEGNIRGAMMRFKLGNYEDALATLGRIRPDDADPIEIYWAALLKGRVFQELKRLPEADQSYSDALKVAPDAQSPAIGRALVLFAMNRRESAMAVAAAVRAAPATNFDPWWSYPSGEARRINAWRTILRVLK